MERAEIFHYCPRCRIDKIQKNNDGSIHCLQCNLTLFFNAASPATAAIILNKEGKILLQKRGLNPGKGKWDLPGGFMLSGETAEEGVKREVKEEVGIEIYDLVYFSSAANIYAYQEIDYPTIDLCFIATTKEIPKPQDQEVWHAVFLAPEEVDLQKIAFPSVRLFLEKYLKQIKS
ncbi:MAG: hypothetical protein A2233_05520 [Candidatus Kerfeldbacteria bacterium RIFOXYA2_FULL_38_24]|uniref:Nudix hydrolase domain-containing protein n=1 Tax=Candidatus Kerfeldbacteria bacterium RIFOXYB2_FULL_38_14 TaxID=1798547 RepID=A0A1G2BGU2_9BACT|nr:MAG: hypothetical protein A2233_05520 [Candidatus Kerfeldbacteria bacterium RIFOXYA2_FULL_38_24]OGY88285.1 MAG: hypothetical protein A2319_03805 [Candidatus Kerfeldbacteria bacterium RIFOXYB2_FULL_38_14]OGY89740.1 MAG: hypothetical protein A2458_01625 [Candidatus Kerfeldbacteria bacterium RIFOXYC2_FULL_38_9]